jgi:hypothetical protein
MKVATRVDCLLPDKSFRTQPSWITDLPPCFSERAIETELADDVSPYFANKGPSTYFSYPGHGVGSVCMDFTMIDISEIDAHLDDVVLLFGQGFSAEKMADKRSTIPYEIFTSIAGRVARIFTRE